MRLGLRRRTLWACVGAGLFAAMLPGWAMAAPTIEIVHENADYHLLAVDGNGVAYGRAIYAGAPQSNRRLYRSADEGQTWTSIQLFPDLVRWVSVTSKNTLFAHVWGPTFDLYRSGDGGLTWQKVFEFPAGYRSLTPHSMTDVTTSAGHFVFIASYNAFGGTAHPNWVWRSADDGRTWSVVYESSFARHMHFVQADPYTGDVYLGTGDGVTQSVLLRSSDAGETWQTVCTGNRCTVVDTTFHPGGNLVFGQDILPPSTAAIQRFDWVTETMTPVATLPGPSYSALALDGESFLVGHTHEPGLLDDGQVHLFASDDGGQTFTDAFQRAYVDADEYTLLLAQFAFPNGHFPIQIDGEGTIVARLVSSAEIADQPTASIANATVWEDAGSAAFTVTLSKAPTDPVTLDYRTAGGSAVGEGVDFDDAVGSISFLPGAPLSQQITVPLEDDPTDEDEETFALVLTGSENAGAADGKGVATIVDQDLEPELAIAPATAAEGSTAGVLVTLGQPSGRRVLVDYTTEAVNATPGTDYVEAGGTLVFAPGETSKPANVVLLSDARDEDSESIRVRLSNSVNAMLDDRDTSLVTISDTNPPPIVQVSGDEPVVEGVTATFGLSLDAPSERAISVTYETASGADTVNFAPLETTKTVEVETEDDDLDEPDEELTLQLVDATNATIPAGEDSASATVLDNDDAPEISIEDASVDEDTGSTSTLSFRLTLSAPSGWTVVVPYEAMDGSAHAPGDFTAGEEPVSLAPGEEEGFIEIEVQGDSLHENDETMGVELGLVEHAEVGDGEAIGTIRDDDPPPPPKVADTTPPFLTVAVFKRGLQQALRRGVPLRVRSSEATDLRIKLRLPARLARRLGLPRVVGTQAHALAAAQTAALSPRFSRKARNKLAPLQSFRLVVEVTGTDQSGNVAVFRRAILLKKPA